MKKICDGGKGLPYSSELKIPDIVISNKKPKTIKQVISLLEHNSEILGHSEEKFRKLEDAIVSEMSGMSPNHLAVWSNKVLLTHNILHLQWDPDLFRYYGPCHPFLSPDPESVKLGGSRMFFAREYDHDEDRGTFDWFTGHCEMCMSRIRRRWHSVRKPMPVGGWKGNFCSWKCCRESVLPEESVSYRYIDFFEKHINRLGIQDRLDDEDDVIEHNEIFENISRNVDFEAVPEIMHYGLCGVSRVTGSERGPFGHSGGTQCKESGCEWRMDNKNLFYLLSDYFSHNIEKVSLPEERDETREEIHSRLEKRCEISNKEQLSEEPCKI